MTISRQAWNEYIGLLREINEKAASEIEWYYLTNFYNKPGADAKLLVDYCYAVVNKYGEASAALSAEMYDAIAMLEGVYVAPAEIAEIASYGDVAKTVYGTLNTSENAEEIASAASRWVKMAGSDTTLKNALRDGAQFAWIPSGETCPFCLMLASNGWQYASKNAIKGGHAEHIHSNCDCQYCISFNGKTDVAGYNPDSYGKMLKNADKNGSWHDRVNALRREAYAEDKEKGEGTNNSELINVN